MKLVKKFSVKSLVRGTAITVGVCAIAIGTTVVMTNISFPENGQGGFEAPGILIATEQEVANTDLSVVDANVVTSETPVEEFLKGKDDISEELNSENKVAEINAEDLNLSYISYRVKQGEFIGNIAQKFNISQDSIISLNKIKNTRAIPIGALLKIPNMSGIIYTTKKDGETVSSIVEKYKVDANKFANVNNVALTNEFNAGTTLFVPDAKMDWATIQEINGDLFKKPIKAKWYKSSSFGWRASPFTGARSYHSGIDMACPTGTSIYSALAGTVTSTGYSPTYGNYVIITHHSGFKTLYGHMSAILCVKGQVVNQDTRIGKVGSTGLSTGPHLHFTVYKNNVAVNPAALWN